MPACGFAAPSRRETGGLFVSTYGDSTKPAIIFVHGGPGFNAEDFELTTAEALAAKGYFVVIYDQRGQGRSEPSEAKNFTYSQYANNLAGIIRLLEIENPILLAHSHGGPIAIQFDAAYPELAKAIILVGAPVNFWASVESLYTNCFARYVAGSHDDYAQDLKKNFELLESRTGNPIALKEATGALFMHGLLGCRLYQTANPSSSELRLRDIIRNSTAAPMEQSSMPAFLANENYIYRDHSEMVRSRPEKYFGIYGDEDGLFTPQILENLTELIGNQNFYLVKGSSHSVYVDQHAKFLEIVNKISSQPK